MQTQLCEMVHYGKSLVFIFHEFFVFIDKILVLGASLGTRLSFYGGLGFSDIS